MQFTLILSLLAPLAVLAAPLNTPVQNDLVVRQARPNKPKPCVRKLGTSNTDTEQNAAKFVKAFIHDTNVSGAFAYIAQDYINHHPNVANGFDSAWNILSPIWGSQKITPLGSTFKAPYSWVKYKSMSFGEVVDKFKWEGGCIVEHWDVGVTYATK